MHNQMLALLTKHSELATQAVEGKIDDAGRHELAKYTAAVDALSGKRPMPGGLVAKVMDRTEFRAWAEVELQSNDVDRLCVVKSALDTVATAEAAGLEKFAVNVLPEKQEEPAKVLDAQSIADVIAEAVEKALDARTKAGVRIEEPPSTPPEPEPIDDPSTPADEESDPAPESVAKGWHPGDWTKIAEDNQDNEK